MFGAPRQDNPFSDSSIGSLLGGSRKTKPGGPYRSLTSPSPLDSQLDSQPQAQKIVSIVNSRRPQGANVYGGPALASPTPQLTPPPGVGAGQLNPLLALLLLQLLGGGGGFGGGGDRGGPGFSRAPTNEKVKKIYQ